MTTTIYSAQRGSCRERGHEYPNYTLGELREWIKEQPRFDKMYSDWVESGYDKWLKPSPDRLDDKLTYSFSNLQLLTWRENLDKQHQKQLNSGKGHIIFSRSVGFYVARFHYNGKRVHIKQSKKEQVCIDALEQWKKDNL